MENRAADAEGKVKVVDINKVIIIIVLGVINFIIVFMIINININIIIFIAFNKEIKNLHDEH